MYSVLCQKKVTEDTEVNIKPLTCCHIKNNAHFNLNLRGFKTKLACSQPWKGKNHGKQCWEMADDTKGKKVVL